MREGRQRATKAIAAVAGALVHIHSGSVGLHGAIGLRELRACRTCAERGGGDKNRASDSNSKKRS